jgi:hypothetical protein
VAELLSSKVVIVKQKPRLRTIQGVATAISAMAVVTEKGPVRTPTLVTSFGEFVDIFGAHISDTKSAAIIEQFFNNGGQQLWISRVVHYTDITSALTNTSAKASVTIDTNTGATQGTVLGTATAPFDLEPADDLDIAVDGGGPIAATFNATAASRTSVAETYALVNGNTLLIAIDGGSIQTITFLTAEFVAIGAATALEVAAVINAKIVGASADGSSGSVVVTSDKRGTGSTVDVSGGTGNGVLGFTTGPISGTGNVANIDAVTVAEVKTIVEAAVAGVTVTDVSGAVQIVTDTVGATGDIQVAASSTADDELGLDNAVHAGVDAGVANALTVQGKYDGAYANGPTNLQVVIGDATNGESDHFNLTTFVNGDAEQVFPNAVNDNTSANDITKLVNAAFGGSTFIATVFVALGRPINGTYNPTGGDDGLAGLADTDYVGSQAGETGFFAYDETSEIRVIGAPDRATAAVQTGLVDYATTSREESMFAVCTLPDGSTAQAAITFVETTAQLLGRSEVSAIYWPGLKILNPSTTAHGDTEEIVVPNTGHVMGLYARIDGARPGGVWDQPAGTENGQLVGVVDLETTEALNERKRDQVYPKNINPIHTFSGVPIFVDGSRVLKTDGNFPSVSESRGVIFISQSMKIGFQVFKHRNGNTETLDEMNRTAEAFLLTQFKHEAFRGDTPEESFFVDTSDKINPPTQLVQQRQAIVDVGVATNKPLEFIVLRFRQDLRDVEKQLAAS